MRVIKFRAWDSELKKMLYEFPHEYIASIDYGDLTIGTGGAISDYRELELQQFTGLLDKNGKEIYEGDVCTAYQKLYKEPSALTVKIVFNSEKARFEPQQYWRGDKKWKTFIEVWDRYDFEVIGNIYENPELLNP